MNTVSRHRACRGCGYDLFSLPADGVCPECGRGIGGVRNRRGPKDPRRVAGQLRRMVARSHRDTWLVAPFWLVPLLGLAACWWFGARWWVWGIVTLAFLSGVIQHLTERARRRDWTRRLAELDGNRDAAAQLDRDAIFARLGQQPHDADFRLMNCDRCGHQYLVDDEILTLYLDPSLREHTLMINGEPWPRCHGCGAREWDLVPAHAANAEWKWAVAPGG